MSIYKGPKPFGHIHVKSLCDECGRPRSVGNHHKCSKKRQARTAPTNSAKALKHHNSFALAGNE